LYIYITSGGIIPHTGGISVSSRGISVSRGTVKIVQWKFENLTSHQTRLFIVVRFSVHFQAPLILVGLGYAGIAILIGIVDINL